jgi:hypothetical protein
MTRVFTGNQINFAKHSNGAVGDVFEIANGCGNHIKGTGHAAILALPGSNQKSTVAESKSFFISHLTFIIWLFCTTHDGFLRSK